MKMVFRRGCLFLIVLASWSCGGSLGINAFPDSKDIELGRQVDAEIRKSPKEYPILNGYPEVRAYVEGITQKIIGSPAVEKKSIYAYRVEIVNGDSTINAFCTPGGYIYVYTGLLKFLDNEASLAGVLGHEIAHAERRHATRRMTTQMGYKVLLSVLFGQSPGQVEQLAGNLFSGLALLKNSRGDETESDTYSFKYLQSTEYYPGSIKYFFEKVQRGTSRGESFERLLSTHPLPQDRFDHINQMLAEIGNPQPTEAMLRTLEYQNFKKRLP
jgi:predicted Zn-dependent protease